MKKRAITLVDAQKGVLHGNVGTFRILIDEESGGAQRFSLLVNTTKAGTIGEEHAHDVEQCTYILQGKGIYYQEGEVYDIGPGTAIYSPEGVSHRLDVISEEDMTYVVVYAPPGPEKELRIKGPNAFKK